MMTAAAAVIASFGLFMSVLHAFSYTLVTANAICISSNIVIKGGIHFDETLGLAGSSGVCFG